MKIIYLCNAYECFYPFLQKIDTKLSSPDHTFHLKRNLDFFGDRSIYFSGLEKLIYVSLDIPHLSYANQIGFFATVLKPTLPKTGLICKDIIYQPPCLVNDEFKLIPYCSTSEFYELSYCWKNQYNLNFDTPESPPYYLSEFRKELDQKSVFSVFSSSWLSSSHCLTTERVICETRNQAVAAAVTFLEQGVNCVVKPDTGYLGLGLSRFSVDQNWTASHLKADLSSNAYLTDGRIMVEAWIPSGTECQSPSVEAFVPREGEPYVTYICDQVFSESKLFAGIALRPEFYVTAWAQTLSAGAMAVARRLQSLGYCGYFDLDAIVDPDGHVYVVEMNPRRTGGTHVHEMAEFLVGKDYRNRVALLSGSLTLKHACTWPELETVLRDAYMLYPQGTIIPVQTSSLPWGVFGYVVMAADWDTVQSWQGQLLDLLT